MINKYVVFRLQDEKFGLGIDKVERILESQKTTKIPRTPAMVLGVFEIRGATLPAVDLRTRFELEKSEESGNFIVVFSQGQRIAIKVDSVDGIRSIEDDKIETDCDFIRGKGDEFLAGVAQSEDDLIVILDTEQLIPSAVTKKLAKVAA